ncbi:hypothetical protein ACHAPK_010722 [Fusarium culmorum]
MVPLGIIAGKMGWGSTAIFTMNFFDIISLAAILSFATEEISKKLGDTLAGLLNATFGNAVELILSTVLDQRGSRGKDESILNLSRGTAIVLLVLYVLYLTFQLRTHSNLFDAERQEESVDEVQKGEPVLDPIAAIAVLGIVTVLVTLCADYLVNSIDDLVDTSRINRAFIGLILIPIVGNAAEHATAIHIAVCTMMDLVLNVIIGSSIQISLLATPFLVVVGWVSGSPMTFQFEAFQTVAFVLSVLVATAVVQDGKSNYLEGAMLIGLYAIIALALFFYP